MTTYKMGKKIITFSNTEVDKQKFHQHKGPISINDVHISKIVVSIKSGSVYWLQR